ncbi:LysR family transcriptional regulator [Acidocella sp.]|uniref:LysR family transcriptional regulator n=1 Tax=Acidocella sp. TaxID=50710 RepID=UPI003CFED5C0
MRKVRIPNVGTLLAFEAAARYESFTLAAKELCLTESAISRQIALLEGNLGVTLFVRVKQRVRLTRAGRLYATQVRRSIEALNRDTASLMSHGGGAQLELAVLPTFASHWLIPRLPSFSARHLEVGVNLGVRTEVFSFEETHFEAAIHYGRPYWASAQLDYLFGEGVVPVCAPSLIDGEIRGPEDLLAYPLLHSSTRPNAWQDWFARHGVEDERTVRGSRYELYTMLISGAEAGLGIALVPDFFVHAHIAEGCLRALAEPDFSDSDAYYLVYPEALSQGPALLAFRSWLLEQAAAYTRGLDKSHADGRVS